MTLRLTHPIPGAPLGDRFGWREAIPGVIGAGLHNGQDYPVAHGTPVYAAAAGTARRGWEANGFGNFITIAHGGNFTTWYAHLSRFAVGNSERVKAGQLIGYVGSTGASTGAHLHFSLRRGGEWLDPLNYIGSAPAAPDTGGTRKMFMIDTDAYMKDKTRPGRRFALVGPGFWKEIWSVDEANSVNRALGGGPAAKVDGPTYRAYRDAAKASMR